jgi:hypothetical protein
MNPMNPYNAFPGHAIGAPDALYDQIECELAALTFAPLHEADSRPGLCVDEFANDFLNWSMPGRLPAG